MLALCNPDFHLRMFGFSRWASIQLIMLFLYPPSKSWLAIYGRGTLWIAFCKIFGADFFMFLFHKVNRLLSFFLWKSWGTDASRAWEWATRTIQYFIFYSLCYWWSPSRFRCSRTRSSCLELFEIWICYTLLLIQLLWSFLVPLFLQRLIIRPRYFALVGRYFRAFRRCYRRKYVQLLTFDVIVGFVTVIAVFYLALDIYNTFWRSYISQRYYIWSRSSWSICFYRL